MFSASFLSADKGEYCQLESFNVTCGEGEIIVLVSALYGRMRPGKCISRVYGNLGCSANVLPYMDTRCSGSRTCEVPIPDPNLHRTQPCPKDFTAYLEVEYQCIKGEHMLVTCSLNLSYLTGCPSFMGVGEIARSVKALGLVTHRDKGMNPITAITFSCAATHFPDVYNLERHQRPAPFIPCLYGVGG